MITLKFTTRDVLGLIQMLCMALVLISETSHNLTIQIHWDNTVILSQNWGFAKGKNIISGLFWVEEQFDVCGFVKTPFAEWEKPLKHLL